MDTPKDLFSLGSVTSTTPGAGSVNVFELSLDSPSDLNGLQASAFTLVSLTFNTIAVGTSPLGLTVNALGDADGNALVATTEPGSVTVTGPTTVPELDTIWLLATGTISLAMRRAFDRRGSASAGH
jgi:hypothetical protein